MSGFHFLLYLYCLNITSNHEKCLVKEKRKYNLVHSLLPKVRSPVVDSLDLEMFLSFLSKSTKPLRKKLLEGK